MEPKRRPGRPRTKPAEERRNDLLDAARRLFLDQGFAPTTVDQITLAAGVAKGTFYLYFKTKEDVRAALAERHAGRYLDFVRQAVAAAPDRPLDAWAEAFVAFHPREELAVALAIDHLAELLTPIAEEPRALAVFLFHGAQAMIDDNADSARLTEQVKTLCRKLTSEPPHPKAPPAPAKPQKPEQRQGSLF